MHFNPALLQVMAWRRTGDKPLPKPMLNYTCILCLLLIKCCSKGVNKGAIFRMYPVPYMALADYLHVVLYTSMYAVLELFIETGPNREGGLSVNECWISVMVTTAPWRQRPSRHRTVAGSGSTERGWRLRPPHSIGPHSPAVIVLCELLTAHCSLATTPACMLPYRWLNADDNTLTRWWQGPIPPRAPLGTTGTTPRQLDLTWDPAHYRGNPDSARPEHTAGHWRAAKSAYQNITHYHQWAPASIHIGAGESRPRESDCIPSDIVRQ